MTNPVAAVPRTIVSLGFGAARVPVDLLAQVTGNGNNREWGPTLAFDSVEATVRGLLGSLLGDPELAAQGHVKEARVQQRTEAAERDRAGRKSTRPRQRFGCGTRQRESKCGVSRSARKRRIENARGKSCATRSKRGGKERRSRSCRSARRNAGGRVRKVAGRKSG